MTEQEFWLDIRRHLLRAANDPEALRRSLLGVVSAIEKRYPASSGQLPENVNSITEAKSSKISA